MTLDEQADKDAIEHAANMIEAVTIDAKTVPGKAVADVLDRHKHNFSAWLREQAEFAGKL